MGEARDMQGQSANLKKAILWLSDAVEKNPEKTRAKIIQEAQLRYDLTPRECEFLNSNFTQLTS